MNKLFFIKNYLYCILFLIFSFSACSKSNIEQAENENNKELDLNTEVIPEDNLIENENDLLTVDYKDFYEKLSPYGEWIEVSSDKININSNEQTSYNIQQDDFPVFKKISLSNLFGISDAVAADLNVSTFFVWKPSPDLAVSLSAGSTPPVYVPYSNGQWINSNQGWYFKAPTPHEEIVHHYGRWTNSPSLGWVWVPGSVWAPAWVDWKVNDNYVAWTPVPPSINIVAGEIPPIYAPENEYIIVEKKYFFEPVVYKYVVYEPETIVLVKSMKRPKGIVVVNNILINRGPEINYFDPVVVASVPLVNVVKVKDYNLIDYKGDQIFSYKPVFKKVKTKKPVKFSYFKPEKFSNYNDAFDRYRFNTDKKSAGYKDNNSMPLIDKNKDKKVELKWKNDNESEKYQNNNKGNEKKEVKKNKKENQRIIKDDMPREFPKNSTKEKRKNDKNKPVNDVIKKNSESDKKYESGSRKQTSKQKDKGRK